MFHCREVVLSTEVQNYTHRCIEKCSITHEVPFTRDSTIVAVAYMRNGEVVQSSLADY